MSTRRPDWWPVYGDPVRCPIRQGICIKRACMDSINGFCEDRNNLALVPMEPPKTTLADSTIK